MLVKPPNKFTPATLMKYYNFSPRDLEIIGFSEWEINEALRELGKK